MNNQVTASVEFFFKGNKICASIDLDTDHYMRSAGKLPVLYPLLARAGELDLYSYEYEMMQAEVITFSQASGLVAEFINEGQLDIPAFEKAWKENTILEQLKLIASEYLSKEDDAQSEKLLAALLEAYNLGENACQEFSGQKNSSQDW